MLFSYGSGTTPYHYPNTICWSNDSTNFPTYSSSQCRHQSHIHNHPSAANQHALDAKTYGSDAIQPTRKRITKQQPQHPLSSHSPGRKQTQTRANPQAVTRFCNKIFLDTHKVCTWRLSMQKQSAKISGYLKNFLFFFLSTGIRILMVCAY